MGGAILALMGKVSRAETGRLMEMDFSEWTLRKDDPRGPGRKVSGMRDRRRHAFVLACASLADLERAGHLLAQEGYAEQVTVYLRRTARPERLSLALTDFRETCTIRTETAPDGSFVVRAAAPEAIIDIGAFVLSLVRPSGGRTRNLRMVVEDASLVSLLGIGAKSGVGLGALPSGEDSIPPFDLMVTGPARQPAAEGGTGEGPGPESRWHIPTVPAAVDDLVPLNTSWTSPVGFLSAPTLNSAVLRLRRDKAGRHLAAVIDGLSGTAEHDVSGLVNENLVDDLRPYRNIEVTGCAEADAHVAARLLTALAGAGVPVTRTDSMVPVPPAVRDSMAALAAVDLTCDVERALWSANSRREVLAAHAQDAVREQLAGAGMFPIAPVETVSVIIASARPHSVSAILKQAKSQKYPTKEIILGLHGFSREDLLRADPGAADSLEGVVLQELDAGLVLGEVLRSLSSAAGGSLLTKMDDDDLYTHDHIGDLVSAWNYSGAELVGCKAEFVYLEEQGITIQRRSNSERFGVSVTGGSVMLSQDALRQAGGWSPVRTAEDRLLQEGIQRAGGRIYRSHGMNYLMSRGDGARGHTFQPRPRYFADQAIQEWQGVGYPGWRTSGTDE